MEGVYTDMVSHNVRDIESMMKAFAPKAHARVHTVALSKLRAYHMELFAIARSKQDVHRNFVPRLPSFPPESVEFFKVCSDTDRASLRNIFGRLLLVLWCVRNMFPSDALDAISFAQTEIEKVCDNH